MILIVKEDPDVKRRGNIDDIGKYIADSILSLTSRTLSGHGLLRSEK